MTLDNFISKEHLKYDEWNIDNNIPSTVISRTWIGLLMLTQVTSKEDNLTQLIVDLALVLEPIIDKTLSSNNTRPKFQSLIEINDSIHCHHPSEKEFINRIVFALPAIEYVLDWYTMSETEPPIHLKQLNELYNQLKSKAKTVFKNSVWSK